VWGYNAEVAVNLSGGNGNDLGSYQSEDPRINSVNSKVLRGGANYLSSMSDGWLWSVRGQFQYSADALISGEQFGLGGSTSVRGVSERLIAGDSGLFSSLEFTSPYLRPGLQGIGFVDAGWLNNHSSVLNPNKPASDQLISIGLGLRYSSGNYGLSADWARVISGSVLPYATGSAIPQAGDEKIHLNFNARF
jgi:hemolysin activation/secretion protein